MNLPETGIAAGALATEHALLCAAVREGGALSLQYFRRSPEAWEKRPGDPVSEADLAVNELLYNQLATSHPDDGWLSEESVDNEARLAAERVWIVDPIDGTRPFLRGRPEYTVCAGLVIGGRPELAAVFNPATDEFFDAVRGHGARCNGIPIEVSACDDLQDAHISSTRSSLEKHLPDLDLSDVHISKLGSIAYRLALVACGRHDATVSLHGKSDWDIAAAELLVTEAGGRVTSPDGNGFRYNGERPRHAGVIAAGPALHAHLMGNMVAN